MWESSTITKKVLNLYLIKNKPIFILFILFQYCHSTLNPINYSTLSLFSYFEFFDKIYVKTRRKSEFYQFLTQKGQKKLILGPKNVKKTLL